jgi:alpha/beta superfamily hydrolase
MEINLQKVSVVGDEDADGARAFEIDTDAGVIRAMYHEVASSNAAVIWMFGPSGGLEGPAGGMYTRLAKELVTYEVASLRVDYRHPGDIEACVLDILVSVHVLQSLGCTRIVLVGHSFGGAVAICAAAANPNVLAVGALSTQLEYTDSVIDLAGRPLLLMHGTRDEVQPHSASEQIFSSASEPKEIRLYECRHSLAECSKQVESDLTDWIRHMLPAEPATPSAAA